MILSIHITDPIRSACLRVMNKRPPDFVVGGSDNPYLLRWYVLPRNRFLNVYIHRFLRSDDDRALHDHPWWNLSLVLQGQYWEHVPVGRRLFRCRGAVVGRKATARHRIELLTEPLYLGNGNVGEAEVPCLSLFITGPKIREWGFWCPQGFKHWRDFVAADDPGSVGPGCGD